MRPLTFGGKNIGPVWTVDGQHIIFQSNRDGDGGLFRQRADGSGSPEKLTKPVNGGSDYPWSVSSDGNVIFGENGAISILTHDQSKVIIPRPPRGAISSATFSPNGRWIAYASESQIYAQRFPSDGSKFPITYDKNTNNRLPLWSRDGKQLFYVQIAGGMLRIMAVDLQMEPRFVLVKTTPLPIYGFSTTPQERNFDISLDGKFLATLKTEQSQSEDIASLATGVGLQINTVVNWFEELKQHVPVH
jgi:Tol biopolymer transport system component